MRRIPMPLLSIIIGLFCGLFVWLLLDQVQPRALRDIFAEEVTIRLEQQARETLVRFNNSVAAHTSTTRLLANHRRLANYLEPLYWRASEPGSPKLYKKTPPLVAPMHHSGDPWFSPAIFFCSISRGAAGRFTRSAIAPCRKISVEPMSGYRPSTGSSPPSPHWIISPTCWSPRRRRMQTVPLWVY